MKKIGDYDTKQRKSRAGLDDVVIATMYTSGKSCNEIAKELGVSDTSIIYRLKQLGLYKGRRGYLKVIINKIEDLEEEINKNKLSNDNIKLIVDKLNLIIERLTN